MEASKDDPPSKRTLPILIAGAIFLGAIIWFSIDIPRSIPTHIDELLTAERAREMQLFDRWAVRFNFEVIFDKPPLQYWLTSLTLGRFGNVSLETRLWPVLFGSVTLAATAWLALLINRRALWLIPLAMICLVACPLFSLEVTRGRPDPGLMCFTILAIIFAQLARKKPAWWMGVAVCSCLGTLQKIALVPAVWLVILALRLRSPETRRELKTPWLAISAALTVIVLAVWPAIQIFRYGMPMHDILGLDNVLQLFGYTHVVKRPYFILPWQSNLLIALGGTASLSIGAWVAARRFQSNLVVREICVISLLYVGLHLLLSFRELRYALPITPLVCLLAAGILYWLINRPGVTRLLGLILLLVSITGGFGHAQIKMNRRIKDISEEKQVAEDVGKLQDAYSRIVLVKAPGIGKDLWYDAFYLFYGQLKIPAVKYTVDQLREHPPVPPVLSVCVERDFPAIREVLPNTAIEFSLGPFICWKAAPPEQTSGVQ